MSLMLERDWVWDFWFARDGTDWHIFYLQAPKSLGNPDLRHRNATIGHARSIDLRRWEVLPAAIAPGPSDTWDDQATWTGSIVRSGAVWWMFYTGTSTLDDGKIQQIGAASSTDLMNWIKLPSNPVCVADSQWYEQLGAGEWYEEAWRDPWVFPDTAGGGFSMFVTARANSGPPETRGVVGHATSTDLLTWTVRPPVAGPGSFGHLEVPQQISIEDRHYLIFSVPGDMQPGVDAGEALTGIGYAVADAPEGPYRPGPTPFVYADQPGTLYAGRIVVDDGRPVLVATLHNDVNGDYVGAISDPLPLVVAENGALSLRESVPQAPTP